MLANPGGHFSFSQIFKKGKNVPMTKTKRELTTGERRSIRKLVTGHCANYDSEYGCLPLDCECPMLGICYTNSAMCRYFREAVLPPNNRAHLLSAHRHPSQLATSAAHRLPAGNTSTHCGTSCNRCKGEHPVPARTHKSLPPPFPLPPASSLPASSKHFHADGGYY